MEESMISRALSRSVRCALFAVTALTTACDKGPPGRGQGTVATTATAEPAISDQTTPASLAGKSYGAGVTLATSTAIADILRDPKAYAGKTVRIEGRISDICPSRGCWMELADQSAGNKMRFKVEDGDMVIPLEAKGQYALAEGVVAVNELSLEASREYAEYQAKEAGKPFDPASITAPTRIVRVDGLGAVLRDQK
jgi:Domain of unknown function (DUF4920)